MGNIVKTSAHKPTEGLNQGFAMPNPSCILYNNNMFKPNPLSRLKMFVARDMTNMKWVKQNK